MIKVELHGWSMWNRTSKWSMWNHAWSVEWK